MADELEGLGVGDDGALDSGGRVCQGEPMGTVDTVIPEGCGALWYADAQGVDPTQVVADAARAAARRGIAQAVRMPDGSLVTIQPAA